MEWLHDLRVVGLVRKDPDGLLQRFHERYTKSPAVDNLIALGLPYHDQIQRALAALLVGFDDEQLEELPSPLEGVDKGFKLSRSLHRFARSLSDTAEFYTAPYPGRVPPRFLDTLRAHSSALSQEATHQRYLELLAMKLARTYNNRTKPVGAPSWPPTPIIARMANSLKGVPRRWPLLAGLAHDFFDSPRCGEQIRNLVNAYNERHEGESR